MLERKVMELCIVEGAVSVKAATEDSTARRMRLSTSLSFPWRDGKWHRKTGQVSAATVSIDSRPPSESFDFSLGFGGDDLVSNAG